MPKISVLAPLLLVVGCAAPHSRSALEPIPVVTMSPVCRTPTECRIMWLKAHDVLEALSGMRVRTMTDDLIQTGPPTRSGLMAGTVTRFPLANERYELRVSFECFRADSRCRQLRNDATNSFNNAVAAAAADLR